MKTIDIKRFLNQFGELNYNSQFEVEGIELEAFTDGYGATDRKGDFYLLEDGVLTPVCIEEVEESEYGTFNWIEGHELAIVENKDGIGCFSCNNVEDYCSSYVD